MYTAPAKVRAEAIDSAAGACKRRLDSVCANEAVPRFLLAWLDCIDSPHGYTYRVATEDENHPFHKLALHHDYDKWHEYWLKWFRILRAGWQSSASLDYKPVFPELYKDYDVNSITSASYKADFADLVSMFMAEGDSPLDQELLDFVDGTLSEEIGDALWAVLWGEIPQGFEGLFRETSILSGLYVGHVHHIHKKGGAPDEFRDIAVPNRFLQNGLVPAADKMYNLVRKFPKDATFSQDKFDTLIQNRVNNDQLYQGSVDLSKATDNLPFSWGDAIVTQLQKMFVPSVEEQLLSDTGLSSPFASFDVEKEREFENSYKLFKAMTQSNWEDEGYFCRWKVGQPLGSLPSFAMLSITHNLLLESLCASLGLAHSPYFVLGDDVVITNKKARKRYIRELSSRAIPLSLHKSYEGRLSEFAGKTFVKGCVPFYCSDHNAITWESLFDWQRSTGIRIPWESLPKEIKHKVWSLVRTLYKSEEPPSSNQVSQLGRSAYELILSCEVTGLGSHIYPIADSAVATRRIVEYFSNRWKTDDTVIPDPVKHTGITIIGDGHPVVLMSSRFADHDGYFHRYRPVELPKWYKDKVRPCTTSAAFTAAIAAIAQN
jgi:hypothetical protein